MLFMKKLKRILHSNFFYLIVILFTIFYVTIRIHLPVFTIYAEGKQTLTGKIVAIKWKGESTTFTIHAREKILVTVYQNIENYQLGDMVKIEGVLEKPTRNRNFHLFSYQKYLESIHIYWVMKNPTMHLIKKNTALFYQIKNKMIAKIKTYPHFAYYMAFLLGDTSYISQEMLDSYRMNGISHLLSISGMHIGLLSGILLWFFKRMKIKEWKRYVMVILLLLYYVFLTGASPSVIRATFLFILIFLNRQLQLQVSTMQLFIWVAVLSLLVNPYLIYHVGFQFSYIICFFLILFGKHSQRYKSFLLKSLYISIVAQLASFPILCREYFLVNFLSPLWNLFFVPLVSFAIFPLCLLSFLIPFLSVLFDFLVALMEKVSLWGTTLDCLYFPFSDLTLQQTLLYYLLIFLVLSDIPKRRYYTLCLLLVVMVIHYHQALFQKNASFHVLDVSQGDALLLVYPHKEWGILIDTGGNVRTQNYSIAKQTIIPYLYAIGLKKIKYFITSHGDFDHMGGAIDLVENFKVENVILNCGTLNALEHEFIKVLDKKKIPYYSCIKSLNIGDKKLYFLNHKDYGNENNNSVVMYTELNHYKFLFMGDAGIEVEEDLIDKYNLKDIDVLKVGHHGSKTSSSKIFIDEINSKYSVISVGKNNRYGHPNDNVLDNLNNSKIYRTDQDGSIMFKIKNNKLQIETCVP